MGKLLNVNSLRALVVILVGYGFLTVGMAHAQQLRVSNNYIFSPYLGNPGSLGGSTLANFHISHQQRKTVEANWRSISQFLNFRSQPLGRHSNFAMGANVINDIEWSEYRLGINVSGAVALLNRKNMRLSVGGMLGFINWGSRYDKVRVYDRTDELVANRSNFFEVDAGLGGEYKIFTKGLRADVNVYAQQLPKNAISKTLPGLYVYPHLFGGAGILFSPVHNLFVGPRVFYRNIFADTSANNVKMYGATTDIGLKAELDRQNMWFGGAYRVNKGGLNFAFGMRLMQTDTVGAPDLYGYFLDMNASFLLPMGESALFGPTFGDRLELAASGETTATCTDETRSCPLQVILEKRWSPE
ncbi:MAG: type IX secretion system membrane protein PorP/SprF [Bacteroidia bacterium]